MKFQSICKSLFVSQNCELYWNVEISAKFEKQLKFRNFRQLVSLSDWEPENCINSKTKTTKIRLIIDNDYTNKPNLVSGTSSYVDYGIKAVEEKDRVHSLGKEFSEYNLFEKA